VWQPIRAPPFDLEIELAVIDRDGPRTLLFPCRRTLRGWIKAESGWQIAVRPRTGDHEATIMWQDLRCWADTARHGYRCAQQVVWASPQDPKETEQMTGAQSRLLHVGARVCWRNDRNDQGTVSDKTWAGITLKWDSRSEQSILHNDMDDVSVISKK
jgi:hypothetical protein